MAVPPRPPADLEAPHAPVPRHRPGRCRVIAGRVCLVTGSSRGIGAGIARLFAARGARVAVHGRDTDAASRVRDEIIAAGGQAIAVTGDITSAAALDEMRAQIERELGPVDILVANAGGNPVPPMPVDEMSEEVWRTTVDMNLTATFLTLRCFLPGMKARRSGSIITISSAAARRPHARSPIAYACAKAGIELLTQDVAMQLGAFGIRANCIAPETILTERSSRQIPQEMQARMASEHPIARLGTVDDVAHAALYLASAEAGWITGIVLDVAGGAVMPR
ncbi:MAG: SDR family oxidoreductase [Kofleriaceae bacterium]|nr:SDR family oxidoreductase [Kofleriaceae bacterium]